MASTTNSPEAWAEVSPTTVIWDAPVLMDWIWAESCGVPLPTVNVASGATMMRSPLRHRFGLATASVAIDRLLPGWVFPVNMSGVGSMAAVRVVPKRGCAVPVRVCGPNPRFAISVVLLSADPSHGYQLACCNLQRRCPGLRLRHGTGRVDWRRS